jgi:hypothetical protein
MGTGSGKNHKKSKKTAEPILHIPWHISWHIPRQPLQMGDNQSERK